MTIYRLYHSYTMQFRDYANQADAEREAEQLDAVPDSRFHEPWRVKPVVLA